ARSSCLERSKQSVRLVVDSGREEEALLGAGLGAVAKCKAPQSIDHDRPSAAIGHEAFELAVLGIERRNLARAKISNQHAVAKLAKTLWRFGNGPGRIQKFAM